jgi:hypothetical protein
MEPPLFFVHVMKTGGTTFRQHLAVQLGAGRIYPNVADDDDMLEAVTSVDRLRRLPDERWERVDALAVHMPFFASTVVARPVVTATILRDPVERTISHLKNSQYTNPRCRDMSLEDVYDDPWVFPFGIHNYQVRVFAMRDSDGADTIHEPIEIDDDRLEQARDSIARVDLLGLHDRYDEFLDAVHRRFGWERRNVPNLRVSDPADVPERLLRRIEEDNAADLEFFADVRRFYARAAA